jgi:hypothetical protein
VWCGDEEFKRSYASKKKTVCVERNENKVNDGDLMIRLIFAMIARETIPMGILFLRIFNEVLFMCVRWLTTY